MHINSNNQNLKNALLKEKIRMSTATSHQIYRISLKNFEECITI